MKSKYLLILPLLVATLQAASVSDLTFTLNGDGTVYSVTDCLESASGSLDIPSIYNDLPVTSIGDNAFRNCPSLISITIPDSVTSIGRYAFYYCTSLTSITIPDSVTSIGLGAFNFCTSLTSITIPDSVTSIHLGTFYGTGVTSLSFSSPLLEAAEAERDARPTQTAYDAVLAERDAKYSLEEIVDLRAGSTILEVAEGQATLSMEVEQSDDLEIWTSGGTTDLQIPVDANSDTKFFRFKMTE